MIPATKQTLRGAPIGTRWKISPVSEMATPFTPNTLLRYEEDYSFLGDARCRTERWDPLKYLALSHDLRTSDRLRQRMDEVATTTHEEIRIDGGAAIG